MAGRHHGHDAVRRTKGWRAERRDGEVTVQLLPHLLASGALPELAVGAELDLAPAVYTLGYLPALSEDDTWTVDELGCFEGRGGVLTAPLTGDDGCSCRVDILDVAGRLFPVNWAASEPVEGRLRLEGALYLDPELAAGSEHGEAVALCRRRYRVLGIRRYRRSLRPADPVRLDVVPAPGDVTDDAVHVADLRLVDDAVPALAGEEAGRRPG